MSRLLVINLIALILPAAACAGEFSDLHEKPETSWQIDADSRQIKVTRHVRQRREVIQGKAAEKVTVYTRGSSADMLLIHPIPKAHPIDDLEATFAYRSDRLFGRIYFRLVLPEQTDPRNDRAFTLLVPGDSNTELSRWQTLRCRLTQTERDRAIRLAHARLRIPRLNTEGMYVDAVVCAATAIRGEHSIWLDDLQVRGHIPLDPDKNNRIEPTGHAQITGPQQDEFPVRMELDRLIVRGEPRFPIIVPHHGESTEFLKQLGVNTVWIQDASDRLLARQLIEQGLMPMAIPPRPTDERGIPLDAEQVSLAPFDEGSDSIYFWYLGTRIPASAKDELVSWRTQVTNADRRNHRPILADVRDKEEFFSHYLDMVATSRWDTFTGESYRDYRDWLIFKQRRSPGSFFWTWIDLDDGLRAGPYMEPEQLRLRVYAALSAGCRGLGFWTSRSLDEDGVQNAELRLTIAELNREIQMIEPFLATGTFSEIIPISVVESKNNPGNQLTPKPTVTSRNALTESEGQHQLEAAVIRCEAGMLLLPVWYDDHAGYVPGQMTMKDVEFVVQAPRTAQAFLITPAGIEQRDCVTTTGGKRISFQTFRETAAVLVTSDFDLIGRLQARTRKFARASAMDSVLLAKSKWERVKDVDEQLSALGRPQEAAGEILKLSQRYLEAAENKLSQNDYRSARNYAGDVLQLLRILQRKHWEDTVATIPHVSTSPYTLSFQQLPEHWRLVKRIGRRDEYGIQSRLASGDFEDVQSMVEDGWTRQQVDVEGVRSTAELYPESPPGSQGDYCLRLVSSVATAEDRENPPPLISHKTVKFSTPPVDVHSGDIVYVTGWVRVRFPSPDRLDHAVIYDSIQNSTGELRFDGNPNWHRFELLRLADRSEPFQVHFALEGLGEMQIDEVQVVTLQPRAPGAAEVTPAQPGEPTIRDRARDLFNRIPGVDRIPTIPNIPGFEQN